MILKKDKRILEIYELQGEIENIDKFNGKFNKQSSELDFDTYTLKGSFVTKKVSVLVQEDDGSLSVIDNVKYYLFDKPPKYKF